MLDDIIPAVVATAVVVPQQITLFGVTIHTGWLSAKLMRRLSCSTR